MTKRIAAILALLVPLLGLNIYAGLLNRAMISTLDEEGLQRCACAAADGGICHVDLTADGVMRSRHGDRITCTRTGLP